MTKKKRSLTNVKLRVNRASETNYIPPPLTVHFSMTRSVRYQPILHTLYYTLHTEHAYCLSYRFLNNVVATTVVEMVEMVEILDGRLGKRSNISSYSTLTRVISLIYHAKSRLNTPVWGSLRSPNNIYTLLS